MRLVQAIKADIRFQLKQGFYYIYAAITIMYLIILSFLPHEALAIVTPIVVFSDPSILGLFFIGGIIMLEKLQGVMMVMVVTPLRSEEYILSKVISLDIIAVLVGVTITAFSKNQAVNWPVLILTVALTSGIFTLCGIMISAGCHSVNGYMLKTIPYMILFTLPCLALIGFPYSWLFIIFPSMAALKLMMGAYTGMPVVETIGLMIYLAGLNFLFYRLTIRVFEKEVVYQD
jgi:fluoroquinolone transport system permease protein